MLHKNSIGKVNNTVNSYTQVTSTVYYGHTINRYFTYIDSMNAQF